jgi:hypothetical protein
MNNEPQNIFCVRVLVISSRTDLLHLLDLRQQFTVSVVTRLSQSKELYESGADYPRRQRGDRLVGRAHVNSARKKKPIILGSCKLRQ